MLNEKSIRELAYVVKIDSILPIEGADRVELATVGGWTILVQKGQFKAGDLGIYFEIDSKVPQIECFAFLAAKDYKIKTQRYFKGKVISQGLLMRAEDIGPYWWTESDCIFSPQGKHRVDDESRFLTEELGVTYSVAQDNKRKANSMSKYQKMAQRHAKLFKKKPFKWLMKRKWGQKLLFVFFGKKRDKKCGWPLWVSKTDEERIENMTWVLENTDPWIVTEKVDGSSTTFTLHKKPFGRYDFFVCSRNVVFDKPDKQCYYDTNIYLEMAEKYNIKEKLKTLLNSYPDAKWITLQGETYGESVQKKTYDLEGRDFAGFNLVVDGLGRLGTVQAAAIAATVDVPWVPILDTHFYLPKTVQELRDYVNSEPSKIDDKIKEGVVIRSIDGAKSFKCVSPEFLIKYH